MAVIYRDRLVGEAKKIANEAIAKQIAMGDSSLIALQQQRAILDAAQQSAVAQVNNTLGDVQDNIYRAQRAQRAESAMLGLQSDVATLRSIAEVQDMTAKELSNIVNTSEQNAINIAGQQSAINKAEVQTAANTILDATADYYIDTGVAKQDTGRMILNGITGALTGALQGALGTTLIGGGVKGLLNPKSGLIKKIGSGLALSAGLGMGVNGLGNFANTVDIYNGGSGNLYDANTNKQVNQGLLLGGGLIGAGLGTFDKFQRNRNGLTIGSYNKRFVDKAFSQYKDSIANGLISKDSIMQIASKNGGWRDKAINFIKGGNSTKQLLNAVDGVKVAGAKTIGSKLVNGTKKVGSKISSLTRINPWLLGVGAGIGAILGGIGSGLKKKYTLNLDDIWGTDIYKQFTDFGLDVDAVKDIVYNK